MEQLFDSLAVVQAAFFGALPGTVAAVAAWRRARAAHEEVATPGGMTTAQLVADLDHRMREHLVDPVHVNAYQAIHSIIDSLNDVQEEVGRLKDAVTTRNGAPEGEMG